MGIDIFHRPGGMLMPRPGNVGIHIVLGKANLSANFIGMDLSLADEIVDCRLTDMENIRYFLG